MMSNTFVIIYLLFAHWLADFVFQSRWMGNNKSIKWSPMLAHVGMYTTVIGIATLFLNCTWLEWWLFVILNGVLHLCIDCHTSRISRQYWSKGEEHAFWMNIGFDQLLHVISLIITSRGLSI